ncbi:MAG TPA: NAD-dependent epimerase/dehydratase family protein [Chthoniobacterales bacterium]|nr:NAD-dependent epimerase/dehydratase family protein [Chthoniobacterales bacterium]
MNCVFVTGAAGFIGSSLCDRLLKSGIKVVGWDNFSTGQIEFMVKAKEQPSFELKRGDNLDPDLLASAMRGCDTVFHFAANADVRFGLEHPSKDLQQNTIATFNVLEAMRANGIKRIAFASTGSVYGEARVIPTPEDAPFPVQTSLYAASKVAGEGLIQAYCEGFGFEGYIFRFVSILGERYTHGHVFDFYKQLMGDPTRLRVLGDGTQKKSYLYVQDCLSALLHVIKAETAKAAPHRCEIYNLGVNEYCMVTDSISWICARLGVNPKLEFVGGRQGWVGDNPFIFLDTAKIRATGWQPALSIRQAVERTVDWLRENEWVFQRRDS